MQKGTGRILLRNESEFMESLTGDKKKTRSEVNFSSNRCRRRFKEAFSLQFFDDMPGGGIDLFAEVIILEGTCGSI